MTHIDLLDTTLRDGIQGAGISLSLSDRRKIIDSLDALGVHFIEVGNPATSPKDAELCRELAGAPLTNAKLTAFGSTRRKGVSAAEDGNLNGLLRAETEYVTIFGKASPTHVRHVLRCTAAENLDMIAQSVRWLAEHDRRVIYDAEHFFDGYAEDAAYALATLRAAAEAGAAVLCLCDTNGGGYLTEIFDVTRTVAGQFPGVAVGIHTHNDCGLGVANAMRAVDAGATHVQGTFLGFGERCGNARLSTLLPNLQLKRGYSCVPPENLQGLTHAARRVADIANFSLSRSMPYVGSTAFAHKGGMHIDGVAKLPRSFEHIPPEAVGNRRRILTSEVSGKTTLFKKIRAIQPDLDRNSPKIQEILEQLRAYEYRGYQFEAAEESFELIIRRALGVQQKFFELEYFKIIGEQPLLNRQYPSSAVIKVRVGGETEITAAEGDGPVHALDLALRKALMRFYPALEQVWLTDFKVRVLEADATTAATVRVWIESTDGRHRWATVGVSTDVIEASFLALTDSIEYKLTLDANQTAFQKETPL